jgi:hypothetical protein
MATTGSIRVASSASIVPNPVNELDCNGWSPTYPSVRPGMKALCTDPLERTANGSVSRFENNSYYVGHDEPSVKFLSAAPGSGNHMTYLMQLARDPAGAPTTSPNGTTTTDYAELSLAPWFGLPICDPNSYPQNPCTPDSDSNTGDNTAQDAGSAFMELQFYPPGYPPFFDAPSCDPTHYCAALNIDSLECTFGFTSCNNSCVEPVNFAFLQTDGVPAGPPNPQQANASTFAPNGKTLLMNPGDALQVIIQDTPNGISTTVNDLSTAQSGFMVASAANGFANTDLHTCNGTPFAFHPEYSTASPQNRVPWAALEGGVLMEDEIGHFEPCSSVSNALPLSAPGFSDPNVYQTCVGSFEKNGQGEGPCGAKKCDHSTTVNGHPCTRTDSFCELSDAVCMPAGPRTITINNVSEVVSWPVAGCLANAFQNGDLDFDGSSYIADWPDGTSTHPTPFNYVGPFDANGNAYPQVQLETDGADEEQSCNFSTGGGCMVPAAGAAFYPFWTLASPASSSSTLPHASGQCVWNFGNTIAGQTTDSLGGTAEYGRPDVSWFAGTLISPVMANPALNSTC